MNVSSHALHAWLALLDASPAGTCSPVGGSGGVGAESAGRYHRLTSASDEADSSRQSCAGLKRAAQIQCEWPPSSASARPCSRRLVDAPSSGRYKGFQGMDIDKHRCTLIAQ